MPRPLHEKVTAAAIIADVSAASSSPPIPCGYDGRVVEIVGTLSAAVTVANSLVTLEISRNGGAFAAATGTMTVAFTGSAAGSTFRARLTGNNAVTKTDALRFTSDGGSTTTAALACVAFVSENSGVI